MATPIFRILDWINIGKLFSVWIVAWRAPCDSLTEWRSIQVKKGTTDRIQIVPAPLSRSANALRVEVRDDDIAADPAGKPIPGGWRAEAVGPTESVLNQRSRYAWFTMFDSTYPANPVVSESGNTNNGQPIWQVITQWHQGENDQGGPPPIAFIVVQDEIRLHIHKHDPTDPKKSIEVGQWPIVPRLDRGQWHHIQIDILWATTGGEVAVWYNGTPVKFAIGVTQAEQLTGLETFFPPKSGSSQPPSTYLKVGLYRRADPSLPPGPFVLYHDEVSQSILTPIWRLFLGRFLALWRR
jgi:Polysaccharide lyase